MLGQAGWSPGPCSLLCHSLAGDSGKSLSFSLPIHVMVIIPVQDKGSRYSLALRFSSHTQPRPWVNSMGQQGHCGGQEMEDTHWMLTHFMSWVPLA